MAINLKNRSFLKLLDFTPEEIQYLLDLSASLKKAKKEGTEQQKLKGTRSFTVRKRFYTYPLCV